MDKPWVLVVDDNEATSILITAMLRKDHDIETAIDGSEAIEKLKTRTYDAVILDLLMPNVDGFAVLDYLKDADNDRLRRVVVVTAALSPEQMRRVKSYGIAAVVRKPFEVDVLLSTVSGIIQASHTARRLISGGMLFLLADLLRYRWL